MKYDPLLTLSKLCQCSCSHALGSCCFFLETEEGGVICVQKVQFFLNLHSQHAHISVTAYQLNILMGLTLYKLILSCFAITKPYCKKERGMLHVLCEEEGDLTHFNAV